MSRVYDSWERLVVAVLSREKLRQLALSESFDSSISVDFNSRFSFASSSHEDVFATRASKEVISSEDLSSPGILSYHDVRPIEFEELEKATQNFGDLIWGGGGFICHVYKGWIDEQTLIASKPGFGMCVAVKMWISREAREEWLTEIHYLSQLHHPNLIKLVGHCFTKNNIYMLVYEFMPEESLDNHLFGRGHQTLSWTTRIKVAIDAARALCFLHDKDKPVIHRNVKPSHVLLDGEFNAKLCGFGLATDTTDVLTRVIGSHGYAAPEYIATGYLTTKCDVYSFGIVVLELLSGRRSFNTGLAADWATPYLWKKKRLMDPRLEGQYSSEEVYDVANVVAKCLSEDPKQRPRMATVLVALERVHKKRVLELLSGRQGINTNLADWAKPICGTRKECCGIWTPD